MISSRYLVVLFAILSICNNATPLDPSKIESILTNPNARLGIVNTILQNQGSSIQEVQEIIAAANGNAAKIVEDINALLNTNVLILEGDSIRPNPVAIKDLVRKSVQAMIPQKLPPRVAVFLQESVREQVEATAIQPIVVSRDLIQESSRAKRSVISSRGFDLFGIIGSLVQNLLSGQLGALLGALLNTASGILEKLLIEVEPSTLIGQIIGSIVNTVVKSLLSVIAQIRQSLVGTTVKSLRAKRDIIIVQNQSGLMDVIIEPIINIASGLTTPINNFVKSLIQSIFNVLRPVIGNALTSRILPIIEAIINMVLPVKTQLVLP